MIRRMGARGAAAGIGDLAAATPASRDRYVDFLRAVSILVVVVGHWTIALIFWDGGVIRSTSAIGKAPGLWLATWLFQVMPVFFFVGGYANFVAYESARRRGDSAAGLHPQPVAAAARAVRVLLAVWAVVQVVLHLTGTGAPTGPRIGDLVLLRGVRPPGQTIPFGPLWFLGVYLVVVCISPLTVALHRRFRWWIPAVMVAGTVVVDALGFIGGHAGIRYLNAVFVFLLPHQLGHFYGDGSVDRWPRAALAALAAVGLGGLVLMTNPWLFELGRRPALRLVPRHRPLPPQHARHRRREGGQHLSPDGVLHARRLLADRVGRSCCARRSAAGCSSRGRGGPRSSATPGS